MQRVRERMCSLGAKLLDAYGRLDALGPLWENHHVLQNAAMKNVANYTRYRGIALPLYGGSKLPGSPHDLATIVQRKRKGEPVDVVARAGLKAAGCRDKDIDSIMAQVDKWVADGVPIP